MKHIFLIAAVVALSYVMARQVGPHPPFWFIWVLSVNPALWGLTKAAQLIAWTLRKVANA